MNKLANIDNTFESYQQLIDLFQDNKEKHFSNIELSITRWFSANMSAALGAILDKLQENLNTIKFVHISQDTEQILKKNNFLSYFGYPSVDDSNHTTMPFLKLKATDGKFFSDYVYNELLSRNELPYMSDRVKDKITEAIYEIFVNAQIHSESEQIYTCGQFFPIKNKIEFTIVDVGIGFKDKINKRFKTKMNAIQAIRWAVQNRNTTKIDISGGIGLALLKEFIAKNKGAMQIISNDGFYQYGKTEKKAKLFDGFFPGTIVNLQFRTDDNHLYNLKTEINAEDIF